MFFVFFCFLFLFSWHWTNSPCKPECLDASCHAVCQNPRCAASSTPTWPFPPAITLPVSAAQLSQWGKSCQVLQALVFGVWQHMCLCPSVPRLFSSLGMLSLPVTEAQRVLSLSTSVKNRFSLSLSLFLYPPRVHFCFPRFALYPH